MSIELASGGQHDHREDYFRIDTTSLAPEATAARIGLLSHGTLRAS